jgi:uncharacterized damage-inducible protein DinB
MPSTPKSRRSSAPPRSLGDQLLLAFETNDRITRYLVDALTDDVWRAEPPGGAGRTIAAIVAHMHNVRLMWLKAATKGSAIPEQLDRHSVTRAQASRALVASAKALGHVLRASVDGDGSVKGFRPDVAGFVGYLIAHDAHHRGQITMLARQLGSAVPQKVMFGMWEWGSRAKEAGSAT